MDYATDLHTLRSAFLQDRPPKSKKTPPKPLTNFEKLRVLHDHIETLLSERYPYDSIVQMLEGYGIKVAEGTLKSYVRRFRTEAERGNELVGDKPGRANAQKGIAVESQGELGSRERVSIPRPNRGRRTPSLLPTS